MADESPEYYLKEAQLTKNMKAIHQKCYSPYEIICGNLTSLESKKISEQRIENVI